MATKKDYIFRYRVSNWRDYNRALVNRGRITFWFDEAAVASWRSVDLSPKRGTPKTCSDTAIQCALVLKAVFHLSLRSTQGFLSSVIELMALELPVPDYSTLCRRQRDLVVPLAAGAVHKARHVDVDATGVKFFRAGALPRPDTATETNSMQKSPEIAASAVNHPNDFLIWTTGS